MTVCLRPATAGDAADLAPLVDLAGEGMPAAIWRQRASYKEDPLAVGRRIAAEDTGPMSWTLTTVAEDGEGLTGLVITELLDEAPQSFTPDTHPILRPIRKLKAQVPNTRFINLFVVAPRAFEGQTGSMLIDSVRAEAGPEGVAVALGDANRRALDFFGAAGFRERTRVPVLAGDWQTDNRDWVLLTLP